MRKVHVVLAIAAMAAGTTSLMGQGTPPPAQVQAQPIVADDAMRPPSVPAGTKWDLRLQTLLDSGVVKLDERFDSATIGDYTKDARVVIPAATLVRGFVGSVVAAKAGGRGGSLTLSFDELKLGGRSVRFRASVEQLFNGQPNETSARVGADAAIGAAMSRLPGGGQGALVGMIVGPGGSISSTEALDVKLPVGTIIRVRIDRPVEIASLPTR